MSHIIIKSSTHHHTFICIIISVAVGWQRQREKARRWWHRNRYGALATTSCCFLWRSSYNSISYHIIPFHTIRPYLSGDKEKTAHWKRQYFYLLCHLHSLGSFFANVPLLVPALWSFFGRLLDSTRFSPSANGSHYTDPHNSCFFGKSWKYTVCSHLV